MSVSTKNPASAYATKPNIVHPYSNYGTATGEAMVVGREAGAVAALNHELNAHTPIEADSVVVTQATIKRGT